MVLRNLLVLFQASKKL
uniref:Uncharacterized protein n=1 Tax=Arundo donax TaxID=35708 RepID=A0A0A9H488_ARUDO